MGDDVISQLPVTDIGDVLQLQAGVVISPGGNIHIRNEYEELQLGNFKVRAFDDEREVYVYSRRLERNGFTKEIIVAINKGKETQLINLDTDHKEYYSDLMNPKRRAKVSGGKILFQVKPMAGRILLRDYYRK